MLRKQVNQKKCRKQDADLEEKCAAGRVLILILDEKFHQESRVLCMFELCQRHNSASHKN